LSSQIEETPTQTHGYYNRNSCYTKDDFKNRSENSFDSIAMLRRRLSEKQPNDSSSEILDTVLGWAMSSVLGPQFGSDETLNAPNELLTSTGTTMPFSKLISNRYRLVFLPLKFNNLAFSDIAMAEEGRRVEGMILRPLVVVGESMEAFSCRCIKIPQCLRVIFDVDGLLRQLYTPYLKEFDTYGTEENPRCHRVRFSDTVHEIEPATYKARDEKKSVPKSSLISFFKKLLNKKS
jgi:hypothetical protein